MFYSLGMWQGKPGEEGASWAPQKLKVGDLGSSGVLDIQGTVSSQEKKKKKTFESSAVVNNLLPSPFPALVSVSGLADFQEIRTICS